MITARFVVVNTQPVADAGPDQPVAVNDTVVLDGSGSSDTDGDALTYSWSLLSVPGGSGATLSDATAVNPTFVADDGRQLRRTAHRQRRHGGQCMRIR